MSFEISINEFNRQFQLYQKGERYNLNLHQVDLNHFIVTFFNEKIEDLEINYSCKEKDNNYSQKVNYTSFNFFFDSVENLLDHQVNYLQGYFTTYDMYFISKPDYIEINYIKRELLFDIVDRLLNGMDCNYKSRLKTELLINMEFD
ncbi:hypothetical protein [Faecalibacter macacae]|uniref:Uncharacterized protein n=1 Tax=Faecalibacter macacae TaxID=1859289 RepID=A0A3L9M573_9FLAO|nr:hypothetical protein [Faecalibacter macacae]RLZ06494.1 hypothetical protein EAH69_13235 [Faecalibacter macacae]